ncbi:hypothetical protein [Mucilaginibacter dorajii]|uniref:Uncharacterized protein n=1 Tax=Mucilaginibacter dorajii TaxID=692994 RepID=A0ABP7NYY8_9SPHI|nr:hypothetical protein [Mucilaginibacter dorajii]MCS3737951.1 antitoxin component HigA of HigAB toxin-antitoxin module [Mucilaginibacter dorajii]
MHLIAKNKIAQYIQQHPETQTAFLTWLKEHPGRYANSMSHMLERPQEGQRFTMMAGVGLGDYQVESRINLHLKASYIMWVGSNAELEARHQAKIELMKAENPSFETQTKVKVVEVLLTPPPPVPFDSIPQGNKVQPVIIEQVQLPAPMVEPPYVETESDFKTAPEYEEALARAIAIFEAEPGSAEFDELTKLIPLIAHYEQSKLDFPELTMLDVVKYKMNMLEIAPQSLPGFIGTAEEIELFLAGKQALAKEKLDWLCNLLWIKFSI